MVLYCYPLAIALTAAWRDDQPLNQIFFDSCRADAIDSHGAEG